MSNRFSLISALAVFALGIAFLLLNIAVWLRFHVQIPVHDIVEILPLVDSGIQDGWGSISLQDWLNPISGNAHRILVTRFLMLADYSFLGGNNYAIYLSGWIGIALLLFAYLRAADLQSPQNRASRYFIAGVPLIFLCSPSQYINLINPISASWYVAMASSAVCMLIIISAGKKLSPGLLILACLFAAIAAFSNFSGVLTCLILPVVALHQRSRLSVLVLAFSTVLIFLYFNGVESNHSTVANSQATTTVTGAGTAAVERLFTQLESPRLWLNLLKKVTSFPGLHLGAPLSAQYPIFASFAVFSSVMLIGYQWLVLGFRWCFQKEPDSRSVEFYLVMATVCLGISCAIPLGRNVFNDPLAARYQTVTMVYWLSISCLIFYKAQGLDDKRQLKRVLVLLACIPALAVFGTFGFSMKPMVNLSNKANATQILGQMGINRFEDSKPGWADLYRPYFENHQEFLTAYGFKPLTVQMDNLQGVKLEQARCEGFRLRQTATIWPGVKKILLRPDGISENPFLTRVLLLGHNGELGALYAHTPHRYELRTIFFSHRIWTGYYRGDVSQSMPITLFFNPIVGYRYKCVLQENGY